MKRLIHPCDHKEVRATVLQFASLVADFYSLPGGADEPDPAPFIAARDALMGRLESMFAKME